MPVSPTLAENLTLGVLDAYLEAERVLLARIARSVAQGIDAPGWAEQQLLRVQRYRAQAEGILSQLEGTVAVQIGAAVQTAANRGTAAAVADLALLLGAAPDDLLGALPGAQAVTRLVTEAVTQVTSMHPRILRSTMDVYRQVISDTTSRTLLGVETRRDTAQAALDQFADRGVTGFVDRSGRNWSMESYAEMAVRTATAHAAVDAHSERLVNAGLDLVQVSDAPQECIRCRPWEGKVLSLTGATIGAIRTEHATRGGETVRVNVVATLAAARAAGLYHPGCRHSHSAFLPGVTRIPQNTEDPQGDKDRQRLRLLERRVRAAKRELAVAMSPQAERAAKARVSAAQAAIRDHVATSTAKRQPQRERLGPR